MVDAENAANTSKFLKKSVVCSWKPATFAKNAKTECFSEKKSHFFGKKRNYQNQKFLVNTSKFLIFLIFSDFFWFFLGGDFSAKLIILEREFRKPWQIPAKVISQCFFLRIDSFWAIPKGNFLIEFPVFNWWKLFWLSNLAQETGKRTCNKRSAAGSSEPSWKRQVNAWRIQSQLPAKSQPFDKVGKPIQGLKCPTERETAILNMVALEFGAIEAKGLQFIQANRSSNFGSFAVYSGWPISESWPSVLHEQDVSEPRTDYQHQCNSFGRMEGCGSTWIDVLARAPQNHDGAFANETKIFESLGWWRHCFTMPSDLHLVPVLAESISKPSRLWWTMTGVAAWHHKSDLRCFTRHGSWLIILMSFSFRTRLRVWRESEENSSFPFIFKYIIEICHIYIYIYLFIFSVLYCTVPVPCWKAWVSGLFPTCTRSRQSSHDIDSDRCLPTVSPFVIKLERVLHTSWWLKLEAARIDAVQRPKHQESATTGNRFSQMEPLRFQKHASLTERHQCWTQLPN